MITGKKNKIKAFINLFKNNNYNHFVHNCLYGV